MCQNETRLADDFFLADGGSAANLAAQSGCWADCDSRNVVEPEILNQKGIVIWVK
jgi:hypothetical protein